MKLAFFLLATAFSSSWAALVCKSCSSTQTCTNPQDKNCAETDTSCYSQWKVNNDGSITYTEKGCGTVDFWNSDPEDKEICYLDTSKNAYSGGRCDCKENRCNSEAPEILKDDSDRLKCYHCPDATSELSCAKQDRLFSDFGSEVICPKGVRYCHIEKGTKYVNNKNEPRFYRGCDTNIYDDNDDDDYMMGLGACGDDECDCGQNKCNTGFHGVKCHAYSMSDCEDSVSTNGGTVQCLSGQGTCGVVKASYHDFCTTLVYNCGFGRNSSGCDSGKNMGGIVDEAEVCYCDATGDDALCDPTNSSSSLVSNLAIIMTVVVFAFKQL